MKIRIEFTDDPEEEEVLIRCRKIDDRVRKIEEAVRESSDKCYVFYKNDSEYYFCIDSILFFETSDKQLFAHTETDLFLSRYKLYELEKLLPLNFIRVSKSAIINIDKVYSVTRDISGCSVTFFNSMKKIYVSRRYYQAFRTRMQEKRKKI